ncbi:MAG: VWA domain-containing protein [Bacteroidota bacterium]
MGFLEYLLEQFAALLLGLVNLIWGPADQFKNPGFLLLLLLIPAYLFWYVWWYSPRRLIVPLSYDPSKLAPPKLNLSWMRVVPHGLNMVALAIMVLALARPISSLESEERYSEGIDIMLVLDTSGSMETDDFKPNRLEVAKETATKFIDGRLDDRIGVVLFAEDAFSYAPLTLDYQLLKKQIKAINANIMPKEGTAMGSAIAVAINRMLETNSPSKVMILLTDGASNRGQIDPITAAKLAGDENIKIYAIGIGKEEYQRRTMFGTQTIKSDLDEATLKEVADLTTGKFFRSTNAKSLDEIFNIISGMEKVEIQEYYNREEKDIYPSMLILALGFFALSVIVMMTFVYNPLEG